MGFSYEIEIKSLLGAKDKADALRLRMFETHPQTKLLSQSKQLNHYFTDGNLEILTESVARPHLTPEKYHQFANLAKHAKTHSVRTRQKDNDVYFTIKASIDETTSENGISRVEIEEKVHMSLHELDSLILGSGFTYQAKWSREREEYSRDDITICIDKNAGYGFIAEFEKMVNRKDDIQVAQEKLRSIMLRLNLAELSQERLARMFDYYNNHWEEYYGTDKTFVVQ